MMITKQSDLISLDSASTICETTPETLRNWIKRAKDKDPRFKDLPFHQVAPKHPIKFDRNRLVLWWNSKTNTATVK